MYISTSIIMRYNLFKIKVIPQFSFADKPELNKYLIERTKCYERYNQRRKGKNEQEP